MNNIEKRGEKKILFQPASRPGCKTQRGARHPGAGTRVWNTSRKALSAA
jgi:hypothetical protein